MTEVVLESILTCPHCGHITTERMPVDACQWYFECGQCRVLLTPKPGDCCVFCSYGSLPCPPVQAVGGDTESDCLCRCSVGDQADPGSVVSLGPAPDA